MLQRRNWMQRPAYEPGRSGSLPRRQGGSFGNARQRYESYLARAREAQVAGDAVEMENCYQHAEHYWRMMRAAEAGPGNRA
jgi:hypothetical protein